VSVRLEQWSVCAESNGYTPPELQCLYLVGLVYGHPRKPDGSRVSTSRLIGARGRVAICKSREYVLGEPDPEYVAHCKRIGKPISDEQPITVLR
jgi:hypothetical protein